MIIRSKKFGNMMIIRSKKFEIISDGCAAKWNGGLGQRERRRSCLMG